MRLRTGLVLLLCLLACAGCGKKKSTDQLLEDLKSSQEHERLIAIRLPPHRKGDVDVSVSSVLDLTRPRRSRHISYFPSFGRRDEISHSFTEPR
jgi:hypothetical protein